MLNSIPPALLPVIQITLPIMITILIAVWASQAAFKAAVVSQNRRLDDIVARLSAIEQILRRIGRTHYVPQRAHPTASLDAYGRS